MSRLFNIIPGPDSACILLYGNIGGHDRVDAAQVVSELMELQSKYRRIDVRINSYGGEVYEGIAICNALRSSGADINIMTLTARSLLDGRSEIRVTVEVRDASQLYQLIEDIRKLPLILEVVRDTEDA